MSAFDVKIDVVSVIVTLLSDEATTDNETELPALTVPKLPEAVVQVGACETVKIGFVDLTAPPSLFSTLT